MQISEVVSYNKNTHVFTVESGSNNDLHFDTFGLLLAHYNKIGLQLTTVFMIEDYVVGFVYMFVFTEFVIQITETLPDLSMIVSNN